MNLKKKMKKFFTFARRDDGFTLVELVVVIAILGVLAGVGTVGYSGYVKKAERANDDALLATMNNAFAAACAMGGQSHIGRSGVAVSIDETTKEASVVIDNGGAIDGYFGSFYEGGKFKVIERLDYSSRTGKIIELEKVKYGNIDVYVPSDVKEALQNSTYADIGSVALTGQVDMVAGLVASMINDNLNGNGQSTFFEMAMAGEGSAYWNFIGMNETKFDAMYGEGSPEEIEAVSNYLANGLVLYAASTKPDVDQVVTDMITDPAAYVNSIKTGLENKDANALSEAALVYSLYTSYAYNKYDEATAKDKVNGVTNSRNLIVALEEMKTDGDFTTYMKNQGYNDANAFLDAMGVVNSSASNAESRNEIMANGFTDPELVKILGSILGK